MTIEPTWDDDDGATEVVADRPTRDTHRPADIAEIARSDAGGRMKAVSQAGDRHRREFVILRKAGRPAAKIALPHAPVFKALWALWAAKRAQGSADPGVSVAELTQRLQEMGHQGAVHTALRALARGEAVRTVHLHVGIAAVRALYYPTDAGVEAFAIAESLGLGASLQVGSQPQAWKRRDAGEPKNLFHYAALLRGGRDTPAEIA